MNRNIATVISQILALLPDPAPVEVADELTVLRAELKILARTSSYTAPEAAADPALWSRLSIALYRYLPNPAGYPWAQQISALVTGQ